MDIEIFRSSLVKMCEAAMHDFRHHPSEETYHRTCGRIEGFYQGVLSSLREIEDAASVDNLVSEARSITQHYLQELKDSGVV